MILPILLAAAAIALVIALLAAWTLAQAAGDADAAQATMVHRRKSGEETRRRHPAAITVAVLVPAVDKRGAAQVAGAVHPRRPGLGFQRARPARPERDPQGSAA